MISRKNIAVYKDSIGIDKDLTKYQNLNTFKMYCKRRKSSAWFPDRKAKNRLYACHCIAGNALSYLPFLPPTLNFFFSPIPSHLQFLFLSNPLPHPPFSLPPPPPLSLSPPSVSVFFLSTAIETLSVDLSPSHSVIVLGTERLRLTCQANSTDDLTVQFRWTLNNFTITTGKPQKLTITDTSTTSIVDMVEPGLISGGTYTCIATDSAGVQVERNAFIAVQGEELRMSWV